MQQPSNYYSEPQPMQTSAASDNNVYYPSPYPVSPTQTSYSNSNNNNGSYSQPNYNQNYSPQQSSNTGTYNNQLAPNTTAYSSLNSDNDTLAILLLVIGFFFHIIWIICFILTRSSPKGTRARVYGNIACALFSVFIILILAFVVASGAIVGVVYGVIIAEANKRGV